MPSGIILSSASQGATQEAVAKVLADHGYEPDAPATPEPVEIVEPKREDFESDEAFEQAQEEHEAKLEAAEDEEEEEQQPKPVATERKPSRRQRAIDKATKQLQEDLRKANERLAALEANKKPNEEKPPQAVELKAPKREDFKSDAEFEEAQFDYRYKLRRQKEATETAQKAAEEAQKKLNERVAKNFADYKSGVAAFKEEHDDFDEVVNQEGLYIPESVYFAIVDLADEGPAVTYYLGKHPAELAKLAEMTPWRAAIEVGRIADKAKGQSKSPTRITPGTTKPKPRLPEPVTPVSTAATSTTTTSRDAAKKRDFRAFKAAQRAGR